MARTSVRFLCGVSRYGLLVLAALLATCSEPAAPPPPVAIVEVSPSSGPVQISRTLQLNATLKDSGGAPLQRRGVTWTSGDTSVATVTAKGVVTGVSLGLVTITATSEGVSGSASISVIPGPATQLIFTSKPIAVTAGAVMAPVVVTALDVKGNTATGFTEPVTVALATNPGGGTLSGTRTVAAVAGVATFSDLRIDKSDAGYTLRATSGSLVATTNEAIEISPGVASQLVFAVQPSTTTAGAKIAPAIQVTACDSLGNTATGFVDSVTLVIKAGTGTNGAVLSGTTQRAAVAGVATFSDLSIDKSGAGYTLMAATTGLAGASSAGFAVMAGAAAEFVFSVQPTTTTAGAAITPDLQVTALDSLGNTATGFVDSMTLAITAGTGASGAAISGTTKRVAVAGVATFSGLSIDKSGPGYTLTATAPGGSGVTSAPFAINAGSAAQLVFTVQPSSAVAGASIAPRIEVTARDALGNTDVGFAEMVTVVLGANPGGGSLSGTTAVAAVAGVASFSDLRIDKAGSGYVLSASAAGPTEASSAGFDIMPGAAAELAFTGQPSATIAGVAITPAITVTARDSLGNTATGFTGDVTVTITAGTGLSGATLSGTTTLAAVAGVATFSDLSIDKSGTGYAVSAAASGPAGATSTGFDVIPTAAARLVFTDPPATATAGATLSVVHVSALDAYGNTATGFTGNVTLAITTGSGTAGATLSGTTMLAAVGGVATFSDLSIDKSGPGFTLTAAAPDSPGPPGVTGATSPSFGIIAGSAAQLFFRVQPNSATAGAPIAPQIEVTARDALGNTADGFAGTMTVTIGTNPAGGSLSGSTTAAAVAGVATFSDLSVNRAGTGYTLTVAAEGPAGATSAGFDIVPGAAVELVFTQQPSTTTAGAAITPGLQVTARDALGNTATSFTSEVSVAIATNAGGGTLGGTTTRAAVAGVAMFSGLSIDKSGSGYTVATSSSGVAAATSTSFTITAGPAAQLLFTVQPSPATAGMPITPQVDVTARDALGNTADGFAGLVTVAIGTNPGGGSLSGTTAVVAVAGVASFSDLSINRPGSGYTLSAVAAGPAEATSAGFDVIPGAATELVVTGQPSTTTAGAPIAPALQVTARDALGNTATGFTGTVQVAITAGSGAPGASLSGATALDAALGVATFSGLSIDKSGSYTLTASTPGVTGTITGLFAITPGPAAQLVFTVPPTSAVAGAPIAPRIEVTAEDALGNTADGFAGAVTVSIASNPSGGSLAGTTTMTAVAGVATFSDLQINTAGSGYSLAAQTSGLAGTTSAGFNIAAANATTLVFTVQPASAAAGAAITPAVQVTARDAFGNAATSFTSNVTIALGSNPSGATLSGTKTAAAVAGVVTFANLSLNKVGTGYTLAVSASGLIGATSAGFDISPAPATTLAVTVQPTNSVAGAAITPAVQVAARDNFGNPVTGFTGSVTMALGSNPGGATLSGTKTVAAVAGVATFAGLTLDKAGTGYTLAATAAGLTAATSAGFNITAAAATRLAFTVQPANTVAGAAISPAVRVAARDDFGNTVTSFTSNITIALVSNPGGATLGGTKTRSASSGVATFSNLTLDKVGTGYELAATASGLTGGTSTSFSITAASATTLAFTVQPGTTVAGAAITPALQVTARDNFGNTATTFKSNVTIALGNNTGGATLGGTRTVAAVAGIATFTTLTLDRVGTAYTLAASASGLTATTSSAFDVTPGAAARLFFTTQPTTASVGSPITPAVAVTARDALGNTATAFTGTVTMALGANSGGATLSGTIAVGAVRGVATFADLRLNRTGTGYSLVASATGLTAGTSSTFNVVAAIADRLVFTTQPTNTTAGNAITPAVVVTARDASGNTVTSFSGSVTMSLGANPGGATLSGTNPVTAVNGVATFANLRVDKAGVGYTLVATAAALTGATSGTFTITAASGSGLAFTVQPTNAVAGTAITPAVKVSARDNFGNTITSFTGNVTVALGNNPGGATLSGTKTVSAVAGVATFTNLSLNKSGTGYTLAASASNLAGVTSAGFNVVAASATTLGFAVQPSSEAVGTAISPAVQVAARDNLGNTVASFTGTITVALQNNPTGATLSGTKSLAAVAGVATFSNLSLNKTGSGYTLRATASGLSSATSSSFTITTSGSQTVVLVGAGDIADCSSNEDDATANLLDGISGTVFTAGDNAYSDGSATDYANCYDPTWGRHKARTRPAPGNHDYNTSGASAYYSYFGANAGPAGRGYYSYDLGDWHIISLNSNIDMSAGSAQETWLRADLAASTKQCTLAYWHHPRFSSGSHGSSTSPQPLWQALYDAGADVVVSGHDHNYQRFAPMTPTGQSDPARGIREFVAGTGGRSHYTFSSPIANTEAYNTTASGVLKLTLSAGSYNWEFIPIAGQSYRDSGTGTCH